MSAISDGGTSGLRAGQLGGVLGGGLGIEVLVGLVEECFLGGIFGECFDSGCLRRCLDGYGNEAPIEDGSCLGSW